MNARPDCALWIGGDRIQKNTFQVTSLFYPDYTVPVAQAGPLDLAAAIGCARQALPLPPAERIAALERAAAAFTCSPAEIEHTVRMTGMPLSVVTGLVAEIPAWLRIVAAALQERFLRSQRAGGLVGEGLVAEGLAAGQERLLGSSEGLCYAVTPANDPRGVALVAANLTALGIPFIIKAASRDALAPRVIAALLAAGIHPNFANLVYFNSGPDAAAKHFKLVDASSSLWTFGPNDNVDRALRWEMGHPRAVIDLAGLDPQALDLPALQRRLASGDFQVETERIDHFAGRTVLRHNSGNCAAVAAWPVTDQGTTALREHILEAVRFPLGCTATKSLLAIGAQNQAAEMVTAWLAGLRCGDPLHPDTQVGYIHPQTLDYRDELLRRNRVRATVYGGERLSPFQARPVVVAGQDDLPDFFGQEIPAYVLAVAECDDLGSAVARLNRPGGEAPRLAVSFIGLPGTDLATVLPAVRSHSLLIDTPTSRVTPFFHEGNDYALRLLPGRLLVRPDL